MKSIRPFYILLVIATVAATAWSQHPPAPQGHAPEPGAAQSTPVDHAAAPGSQHDAPFLLFGKWHIPGPLVEIFRWANFLVLFGLLGYLLRKPMTDLFATRGRAILEGLESGRRASEEAERRVRDIERRLANLDSEIAALRSSAAGEAKAEAERLRAAARAEVERIFITSEQDMRALTKAARMELKAYAAELAVGLAEKRVQQRMTPDKQTELLRTFAKELSDGAK